jgi:hypothetical protein
MDRAPAGMRRWSPASRWWKRSRSTGCAVSTDAPVSPRAAAPGSPAPGFDLDRQRPPARRVRAGVAGLAAVHAAAAAPVRRRLHVVPVLRLLPRRVHGSQVLHRAAAGRPDPGCAQGHGQAALRQAGPAAAPRPAVDHSHRGPLRARAAPGRLARTGPVPVIIGSRPSPASPPSPAAPPARACDANPLAGFGSEASKDQHYVLDAAHTQRKG